MKIKMLFNLLMVAFTLSLFVGCGPALVDVFEPVGANETAFVIPLEGNNLDNQKQLKSVEYLEKRKVSAKRIMIKMKEMDTGRGWWAYKYVPNVMVIKVDRAPVTREWTQEETSGTTNTNEALYMESKESIEFGIPLTVTAYVKEENTARFLYFYAGKQLKTIIDLNVRGYCQAELSKQFSMHDLEKGRGMKAMFIKNVFDSAKVFFAEKGITIDVIGAAGGLRYRDEDIQTSINEKFVAEIDAKKAVDITKAANEFVKAAAARKKKVALEMEVKKVDIALNYSIAFKERWNGALPTSVIPGHVVPFFDVKGGK